MAQPGPQSKGVAKRGWRGAKTESRPQARFNWQRDAREQGVQAASGPSRGARWMLAAYGLIGVLLLGGFVRALLFAPPKTPFVLVAPSLAAPYQGPLPPDGWIAEDVDRFRQLDESSVQAAGTLNIYDTCRDWHSVAQGLDGIRQQLRELASTNNRSDAVIIYVSMHGAVNDVGAPCLILPCGRGISPLETGAWVSVADLIGAVESAGFSEDIVKLLVLDSGRFRVNWGLGTLYNTFASTLRDVVAASRVPNLVVLNSNSPGERGWESPELQGSVFAYYLQEGLSGAADDAESGGNHDRQVSLTELTQYVGRRVDAWAWQHRGEHQHPLLLSSRSMPKNATIAWALRPGERARTIQPASAATASFEYTELDQLWNTYAELEARGAATVDPLAWAQLQHALVGAEQYLVAGRAYAGTAREARAAAISAVRRFDGLAEQASLDGGFCLIGSRQRGLESLKLLPSHTLPLAASFGSVGPAELQSIDSVFAAVSSQPSPPSVDQALDQLAQLEHADQLVEVHFLKLLQQYRIEARIPPTEIVPAAIRMRRAAERAAAPCDERLLPSAQADVDAADATRRSLEDALFAGLPVTAAEWNDLSGRYEDGIRLQEQRAAELRWRDQVLAELPWLAQWLTRVSLREGAEHQEQLDGEIADALRDLIQSLCRSTADEFLSQESITALRTDYQMLRGRIDAEYRRLLQTREADGENVTDALALLALPLLPRDETASTPRSRPESRAALRGLVQQWTSQLAAAPLVGDTSDATSQPDADHALRFLERIESGWRYHPATEMFADAADIADADLQEPDLHVRLLVREAELRQVLATLPDRLKALGAASFQDKDEAHVAWSRAEGLTRAAAALVYMPLEVDAPQELRRHDFEQLLVWQAGRTLEDCYGGGDPQHKAFFAVAAGDYLSAARALAPEQSVAGPQLDAMESLLRRRIALTDPDPTRQTIVERAADVVLIDEHVPTATSIVVASSSGASDVQLPAGTASLYVDEVPGEPGQTPTVPVPLTESVQVSVPVAPGLLESLSQADAAHAGILSFRGHEFASPFRIARLAGTTSHFTSVAYDTAELLVIGPQQRPPDVLFVLDCSASMQQPLQLESGPVRRFDAALAALQPLLDNLARQDAMRIGFVLFGHRARWDHDHPGEVLRQTAYSRPIAPKQMPSDDVELVLPVGRFDPTIAAQLLSVLESTAPWGESPLYLALIEGIRQFPAANDGHRQAIVVVTDGLNKQFNAPRDKRKELGDVLQAMGGRTIPIHVVGFGVAPEDAAAAQQAYQQLAQATQGSYQPVGEAAELLEYLRGLMARESYLVEDGGQFQLTSTIGSPQEIGPLAALRQPLSVTAGQAELRLTAEGGESFRLQLSADGGRLTVAPYLDGSPQVYPLTGDAGRAGPQPGFIIHRPIRSQGQVDFEFSIQDGDGGFLPRPEVVWIDVTPVLPNGERGATYHFYDRNFRPEVGVPVLRWTAAGWPAAALQAEIQFYCRLDAVEPDLRIPVASPEGSSYRSVDLPAPANGVLTIERFDDGTSELRVIEKYSSASGVFPAVRVELAGAGRDMEVDRQFDAGHRICLHRFRLSAHAAARLESSELRITRRDRERIGAWQLSEPVRVDVAGSEGLIVPSR